MLCGFFDSCVGKMAFITLNTVKRAPPQIFSDRNIMLRKAMRKAQGKHFYFSDQYTRDDGIAVIPSDLRGDALLYNNDLYVNMGLKASELVVAKTESDEIIRFISDEQIALLEKEKIMLELEVKALSSRLLTTSINHQKDHVLSNHYVDASEIENIRGAYEEILQKRQRDVGDLQQKLEQAQSDVSIYKMESESKDINIERLNKKIELLEAEIESLKTFTVSPLSRSVSISDGVFELEGWLWLPAKNNKNTTNGVSWKKHYVVLTDGKLSFYKTDVDLTTAPPAMKITLSKLLKVSAVTPSDVHKAESKDIPADENNISRIFQILYEDDVESRHQKRKSSDTKMPLTQFCITLLVMANSSDEQKQWIDKLSRKIGRKNTKRASGKRGKPMSRPSSRPSSEVYESAPRSIPSFKRSLSTPSDEIYESAPKSIPLKRSTSIPSDEVYESAPKSIPFKRSISVSNSEDTSADANKGLMIHFN